MARATLHFFLIGAALLAIRVALGLVWLDLPEPVPLEVSVPRDAGPAEVQQLVHDAMLLEEAQRLGWVYTDPVVRRRLVRNMLFIGRGPDGEAGSAASAEAVAALSRETEGELFEEAIELGMHRTDPVVRQRLLSRANRAILHSSRLVAGGGAPTDAELRHHMSQHRERFASPERHRLFQVFLSRQQRAAALESDVALLGRRLRSEQRLPETAHQLGDPFPHRLGGRPVTKAALEQRFGPGFGEAVAKARLRRWEGPFASAYGFHFVWVAERLPGQLPDLTAARARVLQSYLHDQQAPRARTDHLRRLEPFYAVRVVREEP